MLNRSNPLLGVVHAERDRRSGFQSLWVQATGALIAVVVGMVTAKSAGVAPVWTTVLLALAGLLVIGLVGPGIGKALRGVWSNWRHASRLRRLWTAFRHEVDERRWLYSRSDARSLSVLLGSLRATGADEEGQRRLVLLQFAISHCAALDEIRTHLDRLVDSPWPGQLRAESVVQLFESLIMVPVAAGWLRELGAVDRTSGDWDRVNDWVTRYRNSLEDYGRWARDSNRSLGRRVFRENLV